MTTPISCPVHNFFYYRGHCLMENNIFWKQHLSHHNNSTIFHLSPTMLIHDDITHWQPNQQTGVTAITAYSTTNSSMCTQKTRRWQSGNIVTIHLHIIFHSRHTTCTYKLLSLQSKTWHHLRISTHSCVRTLRWQHSVLFIKPTKTSTGLACQFDIPKHSYHDDTSICLGADYSTNCMGGMVQRPRYI